MNQNFRVVFFLRSGYKTKDGKNPVEIRCYLRGERISIGATGYSCVKEEWDSKKGRIKGRSAEAKRINNELDRIESDLLHVFRRFEFSDELSLSRIKAEYLGTQKEVVMFLDFFQQYLDRIKPEVGVSRSQASWMKYDTLRRHFQTFLQKKYGRKDIKLTELNYTFVTDFQRFMEQDCECKHNTVMRMMRNLKTITLNAQKNGLLSVDPFVNVKIRFKPCDRGFLTDEEIQALMARKFDIKRLEIVRDIFVFSCFTGLAYIDVANLRAEHIVEMNDTTWIMTRRQKTDVPTNIILLDIPRAILEKYKGVDPSGRLLPICSNQKMNAYLKEVGTLCKIERPLTYHLARHTFATMALSKGVPVESVSKMLGHTNIRTTQIYAKITNKKIESDMKALASQLGSFTGPK